MCTYRYTRVYTQVTQHHQRERERERQSGNDVTRWRFCSMAIHGLETDRAWFEVDLFLIDWALSPSQPKPTLNGQ